MEYRGVKYTIVQDGGDNWQWSVSLGNPKKIRSGRAATKRAAILKAWAVIDRPSPPWRAEEEDQLRALAESGARPAAIAKQLGRTEKAIRHRFYNLGIPLKPES